MCLICKYNQVKTIDRALLTWRLLDLTRSGPATLRPAAKRPPTAHR